jgi:hypothetical protein
MNLAQNEDPSSRRSASTVPRPAFRAISHGRLTAGRRNPSSG